MQKQEIRTLVKVISTLDSTIKAKDIAAALSLHGITVSEHTVRGIKARQ